MVKITFNLGTKTSCLCIIQPKAIVGMGVGQGKITVPLMPAGKTSVPLRKFSDRLATLVSFIALFRFSLVYFGLSRLDPPDLRNYQGMVDAVFNAFPDRINHML